jgi:hypothetical protein
MAKGFPAKWAKRRLAAPPYGHAQGCALHMFVMRRSIGKFAAAQQIMVLMFDLHQTFCSLGDACPGKSRRWRDGTKPAVIDHC